MILTFFLNLRLPARKITCEIGILQGDLVGDGLRMALETVPWMRRASSGVETADLLCALYCDA